MADLSKLYRALPELKQLGDDIAILVYRRFMNEYEQKDLLQLLYRPLSPAGEKTISKRIRRWFLAQPEAVRLGIDKKWLFGFDKLRGKMGW